MKSAEYRRGYRDGRRAERRETKKDVNQVVEEMFPGLRRAVGLPPIEESTDILVDEAEI